MNNTFYTKKYVNFCKTTHCSVCILRYADQRVIKGVIYL